MFYIILRSILNALIVGELTCIFNNKSKLNTILKDENMYSKTITKPQAKIHISSLTMMLKGQACNQSSNIITTQFSYSKFKVVILKYLPKN